MIVIFALTLLSSDILVVLAVTHQFNSNIVRGKKPKVGGKTTINSVSKAVMEIEIKFIVGYLSPLFHSAMCSFPEILTQKFKQRMKKGNNWRAEIANNFDEKG